MRVFGSKLFCCINNANRERERKNCVSTYLGNKEFANFG